MRHTFPTAILCLAAVVQSSSAQAGTGAVETIALSTSAAGCYSDTVYYNWRFNSTAPDLFNLNIRLHGVPGVIATAADFVQGTGLSVLDVNRTRRNNDHPGLPETIDNYSAFQLDCGTFGSFINTWTIEDGVVAGGGPNVAYGVEFSTGRTIYDTTYDELWLQVGVATLHWSWSWGGIGQYVLAGHVREQSTGQSFQLIFQMYDSRPGYMYTPGALWDAAQNMAFFTSPMANNAYLSVPTYYGFSLMRTGSAGWSNVPFRAQVSRQNFINILAHVNGICASYRAYPQCAQNFPVPNAANPSDPLWSNYKLATVFALHEVFAAGYGEISMGGHMSEVGAYRYSRP